jgi:hypothetical protein
VQSDLDFWAPQLNAPASIVAVSCTSGPFCVAVDLDGNAWESTDPTGGQAAWTPTLGEAEQALNEISCPTASFCAATGAEGAVIIGTAAPESGPIVTSISPTSGSTAGGTTVTITGANFNRATSVLFGTVAGTNLTVVNSTTITVTSPARAAGEHNIQVTTPSGTSAKVAGDEFTYAGVPTVSQISPTSGPTAGGTTVTIVGTNFTGATAVEFGTVAGTNLTVLNSTTITVTSPAQAAGEHNIQVTTPSGTSAKVAGDEFTYAGVPRVSQISPNSGLTSGGTTVTITGTNFTGATSVVFGTVAATHLTVVNTTTITVTSPAQAAGENNVQVTTPGGTSAKVAADEFTYAGVPTVSKISPTSGPTAGGTTVTIVGTNFTGATAVEFGGVAGTNLTVLNNTTMTVTSPAQAAGERNIQVTTPRGTSAKVTGDEFTYEGVPTVTKVSPNAGPTSGGTSVTITGTNFTGATSVLFGTVAGTNLTVVNSTTITATSPAQAAGERNIQVTTPSGTSAKVAGDEFTYS